MVLGLQHALHAGERRIVDFDELRIVEVDRWPIERAEYAVWYVGGAWIGEELAAAGFCRGCAHGLLLIGAASPGGGARIHEGNGMVVKVQLGMAGQCNGGGRTGLRGRWGRGRAYIPTPPPQPSPAFAGEGEVSAGFDSAGYNPLML